MAVEPLSGEDPSEIGGYRLHARIGAGGMGRVYLAFTAGGRPVALKVMRPEIGDDPDFRNRFRQEVAAVRRVHGLYTAQVLDADPEASPPWLVTAYVAGPSLREAVTAHGPMPASTVLLLMAGVAEALQAIHAAGVVHRDLKPSNVMLAADGPRVIDFGVARAVESDTVTRTGLRVGSPPFMAPEQVTGTAVSPAIDVFALGCVAVYAVTGRPPFGEGTDVAILYRVVHQAPDLDGCPQPLRGLIERCLAKDPAQRPSPAEIITASRAYTAGDTMRLAQSWLPTAIAGDLAAHVPPIVSPGDPAATHPPTVTTPASPADGSPSVSRAAAPGGRHARRRLVAGLAALLAAAAAGAVALALTRPGGGPARDASNGTAGRAAAAGHTAASRQPAAASRQPAAASPSPGGDSCLIGTWRATFLNQSNMIDGQIVQFSGPGTGMTETFGADGSYVADYAGTVLSASYGGNQWTQTIQGGITRHWAARNGNLVFSDAAAHGTSVLREDGVFDGSYPLEPAPGGGTYVCSGNSLREDFQDSSAELTRQTGPAG
jgi:hypothetical protein